MASAALFTAVACAATEAATAAAVEVADVEPKPEVDPKVVADAEFPVVPPVELEVLLTMPAAKEFRLAKLVFPASRLATAAPNDVAANWLFGS